MMTICMVSTIGLDLYFNTFFPQIHTPISFSKGQNLFLGKTKQSTAKKPKQINHHHQKPNKKPDNINKNVLLTIHKTRMNFKDRKCSLQSTTIDKCLQISD